jgi:protein ImuA
VRSVPDALRRAVRALEGRPETLDDPAGLLPFGIASIDAALGGGLPRAGLHEIVAASEPEAAAATGFALALAAGFAAAGADAAPTPRAVLWVAEAMTQPESGAPYGPGFDAVGLLPEAVVLVRAAHARDVLWAMEEGLHCRAVGAVLGELRKPNAVDGVASRRLSLAATHERRPALLLRAQPEIRPAAAATRWVIGAAPSRSIHSSPGPPVFAVRLVRNRHGRLGAWNLEWNRAAHRFALAPAHPQPLAAEALDRPPPAAVA